MISNRLKAQLIILTALLLGIIVGASGQYLLYKRNVSPPPCDTIAELKKAVIANKEQQNKIDIEAKTYRKDYEYVKAPIKPQLDKLRYDFRSRVRALLNPDQQKLYDQWNKEYDAKTAK